MYPNLNAEMARAGITKAKLAKIIGKSTTTISQKCSGQVGIDIKEAFAIKEAIGCRDVTLDELFAWRD
jgi:DNA-binding XRE family transcriptional regulator